MPGKLVQGTGEFKGRSLSVDLGPCEPSDFTLCFNLGGFLKAKLISRISEGFNSSVVYRQITHAKAIISSFNNRTVISYSSFSFV